MRPNAAGFRGPCSCSSATRTATSLTPLAKNLTRIVVEGATVGEWLRLTVDPRTPEIFSWERVLLP